MALYETFEDTTSTLSEELLTEGYIVLPVEDRSALDDLRHEVVVAACQKLECSEPENDGEFLDTLHERITLEQLNPLRLGLYREFSARTWFRPTYFRLARQALQTLVGNELGMQNRINFSIQMPDDRTSLLDIHADVFSGESPYQVVQWVPLVDVSGTKSMFVLPRAKSEQVTENLADLGEGGMKALYERVASDLVWLDVPYGHVVIFSPNFLHGNVLNTESSTRWSLNCRVKGLFTPYASPEKGLGSFYLPITTRPLTRLGVAYRVPSGFKE